MKKERLRIWTATWGYLEGMKKSMKRESYKNSIKEGKNNNVTETKEKELISIRKLNHKKSLKCPPKNMTLGT